MIDLRCVTLVCFENRDHRAAVSLLNAMCALANFGDVRLMNEHEDYAGFTLLEATAFQGARTTHLMYCHLDGYIVNPHLWNPEWLACDFIGAPWPVELLRQTTDRRGPVPDHLRVGNGGFSLSTVRLREASYELMNGQLDSNVQNDVVLCSYQRPQLEAQGFKWASVEDAARFSTELPCPETQPESFGFHKYGHPIWGQN